MWIPRLLLAFAAACAAEVRVVMYTGDGADATGAASQRSCLEKHDGGGFNVSTAARITAEVLSTADVLVLPGGDAFYFTQGAIDIPAVQAFVRRGNGYYGTCAGAYAGCKDIAFAAAANRSLAAQIAASGNQGMGLSDTTCHMFFSTGLTTSELTPAGRQVFGSVGDLTLTHVNGPYFAPKTATAAAVFASSTSGEAAGQPSVVVDTYGTGRSILLSPHPEDPSNLHCDIVVKAAAYAAGL